MRYIAILPVLILMVCTGCKAKVQAVSESQKHAKVDSIVGTRLDDLNRLAMEDLDRRKSIEVKAKADSIVEVYVKSQSPKIDSTKK